MGTVILIIYKDACFDNNDNNNTKNNSKIFLERLRMFPEENLCRNVVYIMWKKISYLNFHSVISVSVRVVQRMFCLTSA